MTDSLTPLRECLDELADDFPSIPVLQPADPFLETAGEELRRQIYMTDSDDGSLNCLRPEFTIPICLHHLATSPKKSATRYGYLGKVFRQGESECLQAGIEDIGDSDSVSADVRCVSGMVSGLDSLGANDYNITLGSKNLFARLVSSLDLPTGVSDRLLRGFGGSSDLNVLVGSLDAASESTDDEATRLARDGDIDKLTAHIESIFEQTNMPLHIGRSPLHIAERMITKSGSFLVDDSVRTILENFLGLECPLTDSLDLLRDFTKKSGISDITDSYAGLLDALTSGDIPLDRFTFCASFGRKMDYYTGILFEATTESGDVIAAGGRYDRLCGLLGSSSDIPAVGFSLFPDRVVSE